MDLRGNVTKTPYNLNILVPNTNTEQAWEVSTRIWSWVILDSRKTHLTKSIKLMSKHAGSGNSINLWSRCYYKMSPLKCPTFLRDFFYAHIQNSYFFLIYCKVFISGYRSARITRPHVNAQEAGFTQSFGHFILIAYFNSSRILTACSTWYWLSWVSLSKVFGLLSW